MATGHWRDSERVALVELHSLRFPRILFFSAESTACPFTPGVHLPLYRMKEQKIYTQFWTPFTQNKAEWHLCPSVSLDVRSCENHEWTKTTWNNKGLQSLKPAGHSRGCVRDDLYPHVMLINLPAPTITHSVMHHRVLYWHHIVLYWHHIGIITALSVT